MKHRRDLETDEKLRARLVSIVNQHHNIYPAQEEKEEGLKVNSKGHLYVSIAKSAIRIVAGAVALVTGDIKVLAGGIVVAEILGVVEELVDFR